jgi:hypothetical protein
MRLREVYRRAFDLHVAVMGALGVNPNWTRWPASPTPADLDRTPVSIEREGDRWVAFYDLDSVGGIAWSGFDAHVKSLTMTAIMAHKNLKDLARESGIQYSTLWRAKEGRAVPASVIDYMAKVPSVVLLGPHGPIEDRDVCLSRDEAVGLLKHPMTPEQWYRGTA